jgi:hypothetical protein
MRDAHDLRHDQRRQVRQDVPERDAPRAGAHGRGGLDVFGGADRQHLRAQLAAGRRPHDEGDHKDLAGDRGPEVGAEHDHERQQGQRHHDVHEAHECLVDKPAAIAGGQGDESGNHRREQRHRGADRQRNPAPEQQARPDLLTDVVASEPVAGARRLEGRTGKATRFVWAEPRPGDRRHRHRREDADADPLHAAADRRERRHQAAARCGREHCGRSHRALRVRGSSSG